MIPLPETAGPAAPRADEARPCRSCGLPIIWRKHERTERSMPIDAAPAAYGTLWLNPDGRTYRIETGGLKLSFAGRLHHSHYETCPAAAEWRKRTRGGQS
jgi:hypothetical protein